MFLFQKTYQNLRKKVLLSSISKRLQSIHWRNTWVGCLYLRRGYSLCKQNRRHLFLSLHLKKIHSINKKHGDIRASNIIISPNPLESCFVDLEFITLDHYPRSFNTKIPDGKRHKDAIKNKLISKEHDLFSFSFYCKLHSCGNNS
eukprot:TRINITY_DN10360_c0_g1_i1.p1 TRINITY_DN10360_c0_g1~~TRINITY_DN10360_c0_g1_i1.p1  ORF type:complete len:145 (-),score=19.91 TRINITY_DN10360_c0_g1_i1:17-451(-)